MSITSEQRDAIEYAQQVLRQVEAGDGTFVGQCADAITGLDALLAAAPVAPAAAAMDCQACGDQLTAHDPGICGNCYAMKYRDRAPAAAAPSDELPRAIINADTKRDPELRERVNAPLAKYAQPDERAAFEAWKDKRLPHYNLRHQFREWLFEAFQAGADRASASQATKGWIDLYESAMKTLSPAFDYIQSHADQFGANAGDCKMAIIAETFPQLAAAAAVAPNLRNCAISQTDDSAPRAARASAPQADDEPLLDKRAQVGCVTFGVGVGWSTVIGAAQRHYEYMRTPEKEAERIAHAEAFAQVVQRASMSDAAHDVLTERERQCSGEGFSPMHDDRHAPGVLSIAGAAYALAASDAVHPLHKKTETFHSRSPDIWPWSEKWWKPTNPRRALVKAGALILAEIERLDRAAQKDPEEPCQKGTSA